MIKGMPQMHAECFSCVPSGQQDNAHADVVIVLLKVARHLGWRPSEGPGASQAQQCCRLLPLANPPALPPALLTAASW